MVQPSIATNTLFYGDNLPILRECIPPESVDLVYLDPPFNSNRNYSVLFRDESGKHSEAQIEAFEDTSHWNEHAEATFRDIQVSFGQRGGGGHRGDRPENYFPIFRNYGSNTNSLLSMVMSHWAWRMSKWLLGAVAYCANHVTPRARHLG